MTNEGIKDRNGYSYRGGLHMSAENILGFIIFLFVALIMVGIGVSQIRSKTPVGFYSGEKPPREEELINVHEWNIKHGKMWIIYGVIMIIGYLIGGLIGDSIWSAVPMCGGVVLPLGGMIWYHHKLIKKYRR